MDGWGFSDGSAIQRFLNLAEDPGSAPSIHMAACNCLSLQFLEDLMPLPGLN